ncbi:MAG: bile acid:sodium symporter [Bacteroidales bacterium]|jgi:BASS family bile acid:Na+ symporter|nr:bile acid:sodium symporter [Bacteroidales bacterium]
MQSIFSTYLLPLSLIIIMMGMGLSLEKKDFTNIYKYPKPALTGIIGQILLPLVTFLLIGFTSLAPVVKVGFILISACAGGSATNVITHMLKGNLALSVSLTAINSLIILVTLPLIVKLSLQYFIGVESNIHLSVYNTIANILFTIIIPILIGMIIRHNFFRFAIKTQRPLRVILPLILFTVFAVIIFFEEGTNKGISNYLYLVPWALLLNFVSMLVVYIVAKYIRLGGKNNFTISIEVGLKNSIVGIYVAESLLNNTEMAMVAVVYGSITFFSTLFFGYLAKRIELWGFGYKKLI